MTALRRAVVVEQLVAAWSRRDFLAAFTWRCKLDELCADLVAGR